jgi:putative membrane protein
VTIGALLPAYRELLALHVISVIVWMAGLIMLPAIYARHVATTPEVAREAGFVELERGIIKRFVNPAMYAAWGFGILLIATPGTLSWSASWWWTKFIAVLALSGYHGIQPVVSNDCGHCHVKPLSRVTPWWGADITDCTGEFHCSMGSGFARKVTPPYSDFC